MILNFLKFSVTINVHCTTVLNILQEAEETKSKPPLLNKDKNRIMNYFFFFLAPNPSSSAASLARFSRTPINLTLALFILKVWNADCFFSSSVMTLALVSDHTCLIGWIGPVIWVATSSSA